MTKISSLDRSQVAKAVDYLFATLKSLGKLVGAINKVLDVSRVAVGIFIDSMAVSVDITPEVFERNKRGAVGRSTGLRMDTNDKTSEAGKINHGELHLECLLNGFNLSCLGLEDDSWCCICGGARY